MGWNLMICKIPSNQSHSIILRFYEKQATLDKSFVWKSVPLKILSEQIKKKKKKELCMYLIAVMNHYQKDLGELYK